MANDTDLLSRAERVFADEPGSTYHADHPTVVAHELIARIRSDAAEIERLRGDDEGAVIVRFIPRPDGGLRVTSPDLPGLILSGLGPSYVAAAIPDAIKSLQDHAAAIRAMKDTPTNA